MILSKYTNCWSKLPLVFEIVIGIIILRNENLIHSCVDRHSATQTDAQTDR